MIKLMNMLIGFVSYFECGIVNYYCFFNEENVKMMMNIIG